MVDLDELVLPELRDLQARGRVHVDVTSVAGARVWGDPDQLRRLVRNLVDNAELHAATTVRVELAQTDPDTVILAVGEAAVGARPVVRLPAAEPEPPPAGPDLAATSRPGGTAPERRAARPGGGQAGCAGGVGRYKPMVVR